MPIEMLISLGLLALFLISFFGSGPIPLPLTATVLWLGQFHFPWLVVLVATAGTLLGWICLQGVLKQWVLKNPQVTQRIPVAYQRFFLRRVGFWLFVFNALPIASAIEEYNYVKLDSALVHTARGVGISMGD